MKYNLEFIIFDIKKKKVFYLFPVLFLWFFFIPFLMSQAQNIIINEDNPAFFFNNLQKVFPLVMIYYLYLFFKNFLDNESMEAVYSMNTQYKIIFIFYILILYQVILLPVYLVSFHFFDFSYVMSELINLNFILLYLSLLFYSLSYLLTSPIMSIGIVLLYCFLFVSLLPFINIINVFHINVSIQEIQYGYYLRHIIELTIIVMIGMRKEKNIKV